MTQPSRETKQTLDQLNAELQQIMVMLGNEELEATKKQKAYERISELTEQIVGISKRGDAPVYVVNLTSKRWIVNRSYSSFWIPGRAEGQEYSVTEITGRSAVIDTGRGGEANPRDHGWRVKFDSLYYTAHNIAIDVAREINGDLPAMISTRQAETTRLVKTMGVFVSPTRVPAPDLLASEKKKMEVFCAALLSEGNAVWDRTKDYRQISDLYRFGAEYLGISTEWHENLLNRMPCPGCGESVRKNIATHPACGAILDRAKAEALGMIKKEQPQPQYAQQGGRR